MDWPRLEEFRSFMAQALGEELAAAEGEARTLWIDAVAAPSAIDLALLDAIDRIGPYGPGHPDPVFALQDVRVSYAAPVGADHVPQVEHRVSSKNRLVGVDAQPL